MPRAKPIQSAEWVWRVASLIASLAGIVSGGGPHSRPARSGGGPAARRIRRRRSEASRRVEAPPERHRSAEPPRQSRWITRGRFPEAEALHRRAMAARASIGARIRKLRKSSAAHRRPERRTRGVPESARHRPHRSLRQSATGAVRARRQGHQGSAGLSRSIARGSSATIPDAAVLRLAALDMAGAREEADAVFQRLSAAFRTDAG